MLTRFPAALLLSFLAAGLPAWAGQAYLTAPPPDLPSAACMALLQRGQDASNDLEFAVSESLTARAVAMAPNHPLPLVFMEGVLLTEIQERLKAGQSSRALYRRFDKVASRCRKLADAFERERQDACGKLYQGGCLGTRGLVEMARGSVIRAYLDGTGAAADLRQAVRMDPSLYDAYLGLGQYEYYCGRMSGWFQFLLNLHGSVPEGLRLLKLCAQKATYAAFPARACLARIYSEELKDFPAGLPTVSEVYHRYPVDYYYVRYAVDESLGLGLDKPQARALLKQVCDQWDAGWRPPRYVAMDLGPARRLLARAYAAAGQDALARRQWAMLAQGPDKALAREARGVLAGTTDGEDKP